MLQAYDLVLLMDVIEHVDDDTAFLKTSLAHLKPGGIVVINVPAHMAFYSKYDEVAGHKRRYSTADLRSLFIRRASKPSTLFRGEILSCLRSSQEKESCILLANERFEPVLPHKTRPHTGF